MTGQKAKTIRVICTCGPAERPYLSRTKAESSFINTYPVAVNMHSKLSLKNFIQV
jgi:hypothetical protein